LSDRFKYSLAQYGESNWLVGRGSPEEEKTRSTRALDMDFFGVGRIPMSVRVAMRERPSFRP